MSNRFHAELYRFVYDLKPEIVVETGFATGKSAIQVLAAMDANEKGRLYSVECFAEQAIFHHRLCFVRGMSHDRLVPIFMESGPWDIFLHDSDHEVGCQTFEYELAWAFLKPGGVLMSDDYEWGTHRAWAKFCARHDLFGYDRLGSVAYCRKPSDPTFNPDMEAAFANIVANIALAEAQKAANAACKEAGVEAYFK